MKRILFVAVGVVSAVLLAQTAEAVDKCKVKVDRKSGLLRIDAAGVETGGALGTLKWGSDPGEIDRDFFNANDCITGTKAKRCVVADPTTLGAKTPPSGCTVYLADDSGNDCSAWIKGCTPGTRDTDSIEALLAALRDDVTVVEGKTECISFYGPDYVIFNGCNVHVRSGSGGTSNAVNGLGNLIVGYNEDYQQKDRSGSHNLVMGKYQTYSSYGGIVVGASNNITAPHASVIGGEGNTASGQTSSVVGGRYNEASGEASLVAGGSDNTAGWRFTVVSGGTGGLASGEGASVSGGNGNTASGYRASVSGGIANVAGDFYSSVSGGGGNTASGRYSSVSGGNDNVASWDYASVSGGKLNTASGLYSTVSGGDSNVSSGRSSTVGGGDGRSAVGNYDWQAGSLFEDQ